MSLLMISPTYALRSYFYVGAHGFIAWITSLVANDKVLFSIKSLRYSSKYFTQYDLLLQAYVHYASFSSTIRFARDLEIKLDFSLSFFCFSVQECSSQVQVRKIVLVVLIR